WPRAFAPVGTFETQQPAGEVPFFLQQEPLQSRLTVGVTMAVQPSQPVLPAPRMPILRALGQAGTTYLIAEGPAGLYLIDQHAAHERVMYEHIRAARAGRAPQSQGLLAPVALELSPAQASLAAAHASALAGFGFEVEAFGPASN